MSPKPELASAKLSHMPKPGYRPYATMRRFLRRVLHIVLVLTFLTLLCPTDMHAGGKKTVIHAGYRTLSSSLPSERLMLRVGVWYPTLRRPNLVKVGDWRFRAARNAPVLTGSWPVIVLSHDVTGNAWAHHDIAAALARRGYIVAAPTHDHDNCDDMSMLFSDRELPLRAVQIRAALDLVLEHPRLSSQADAARIGYLGFGLTAPSGLLLAGASLTPDGWPNFVEEQRLSLQTQNQENELPSQTVSPWLQPYVVQRMEALVESMRHRADERREKMTMQNRASDSRLKFFTRLEDSVERTHARQMKIAQKNTLPKPPVALPLLPPLSLDQALVDSRFGALALVSPGYSMLFSRESLALVQRPVFLAAADKDSFNRPTEQALRIASMLPHRPSYLLLPDADMASFHAHAPSADPARALGGVYASPGSSLSAQTLLIDRLHDFFSNAFSNGTSQ